jgi:hypothetical protein
MADSPVLSYRLFLVPSASWAVRGERVLTRAGIRCRLIPVPRSISSECGVCLRVESDLCERAAQALAAAEVQITDTCDLPSQEDRPS